MHNTEFHKLINKAISDNDYVAGLSAAVTRFSDTASNLTSEQKIVALRLIRGFAAQIMNRDLGVEVHGKSAEVLSCDYCGRTSQNSQLTQGHSGVICNVCVGEIFRRTNE